LNLNNSEIMSTLEVADNSLLLDNVVMMNGTQHFVERENKSDVMGLPGILVTSILLGLMTLTTIIGKSSS